MYLEGSPHHIEVISDHKNLEYFHTTKQLIDNKLVGQSFCQHLIFKSSIGQVRYMGGQMRFLDE